MRVTSGLPRGSLAEGGTEGTGTESTGGGAASTVRGVTRTTADRPR